MGYTALDIVRKKNLERYGIDGPKAPDVRTRIRILNSSNEEKKRSISELEERAIHFIRERCEELRFNPDLKDCDDREGTSLKPHQIPYNMEMDLDRLCLENAIHIFLESGESQDAFDIYYIYLQMFTGEYKKTKKLIERLSEFESNASSLLMSHRDHYSHSVYVFLIGLAIYDSCPSFRSKYNDMYGVSGNEGANHYLKYWGLTSLFHDIGYPFELPFEEVVSYFGENPDNVPYVCYRDMDKYTKIDPDNKEKAKRLANGKEMDHYTQILAWRIAELLGPYYSERPRMDVDKLELSGSESYEEYINRILEWKSKDTRVFGNPGRHLGYMDHAFFSANLLMDNLMDILDEDDFNVAFTDAFTAIVLHNSIFKHIIQNQKSPDKSFDYKKHAIHAEVHPLAYMLMLCDELQCWDRISYGQNSRIEVHSMACDLRFEDNEVIADYKFDKAMEGKANRRDSEGNLVVGGTYMKMVKKSKDGVIKFQRDIEEIVALNCEGELDLTVNYGFSDNVKFRKRYLSSSNFMHLYDFAVIHSGRKKYRFGDADKDEDMRQKMEDDFENRSLEYKLINLDRVKSFARYLDEIGCFFTDRAVAYPMLTEFEQNDMEKIGPLEHERWLMTHHMMGWQYGDKYEEVGKDAAEKSYIRELTRTHKLMIETEDYSEENIRRHYDELEEGEKEKDTEPMNKLITILSMLDGVKFYKFSSEE